MLKYGSKDYAKEMVERSEKLMKVYVTFTDKHKHIINGKLFNEDTVAVIECATSGQGREKVFDIFGCAFFLCLDENVFNRNKHKYKTFIEVEK